MTVATKASGTGLLMRGFRLNSEPRPFPPFSLLVRKAIENAIREAWQRVKASFNPGDLADAIEPEITAALQEKLNELRHSSDDKASSFSASAFEHVSRGEECCNYNYEHIEKRPDLTFRLAGRRPGLSDQQYYALYVECKIVDAKHSVNDYCKNGLSRFIIGDYGWAMSIGMMVAYARGTESIANDLNKKLTDEQTKYLVRHPAQIRPGEGGHSPVHFSNHGRSFTYPSSQSPGDIEVAHLWLRL